MSFFKALILHYFGGETGSSKRKWNWKLYLAEGANDGTNDGTNDGDYEGV